MFWFFLIVLILCGGIMLFGLFIPILCHIIFIVENSKTSAEAMLIWGWPNLIQISIDMLKGAILIRAFKIFSYTIKKSEKSQFLPNIFTSSNPSEKESDVTTNQFTHCDNAASNNALESDGLYTNSASHQTDSEQTTTSADNEGGRKNRMWVTPDIWSAAASKLSEIFNYFGYDKMLLIVKFFSKKGILYKILRWLSRIYVSNLSAIKIKQCNLFLRGPMAEPSMSGKLYGWVAALYGIGGVSKKCPFTFEYEPVFFEEEAITFKSELLICSSLGKLLLPVFTAVATFPYFTAFSLLRKIRRC